MQSHLRQSGITSKIASVEHGLNARISRLTSSPSYVLRQTVDLSASIDRILIIVILMNDFYNHMS